MGEESFGIPKELARCLVTRLELVSAVETGTYLGDTTQVLRELVPDVWTVELSTTHAQRARARYGGDPRVRVLQGDSRRMMPGIASAVPGPSLYWLDAHWCGLDTAGEAAQCPLLDEIAAIDQSPGGAGSCILIDDARLFLGGPPEPFRGSDWPSFLEIVDALRARHERFVTVLLDVIIAGPPDARRAVEGFWQDRCHRQTERRRRSLLGRLAPLARAVMPQRLYTKLWRRVVDP